MKTSLSPSDIQYIRHILGRMPNDDETTIIENLQLKYKKGRLYTETLNRLDDGIQRARIPEEDLMDEEGNHIYFYSGLTKGRKAIESTASLLEVESRSSITVKLDHEYSGSTMTFSTGLVKASHPTELHLAPAGSEIAFLELPAKRIPKATQKRISDLLEKPWILGTRIVDQWGLPQALSSWCIQNNIGVTIGENIFDYTSTGLIIVIRHGFLKEMRAEKKDWQEPCTLLGTINDKQEFQLKVKGKYDVSFPVDVLRYPWRVYTQTRFHREELKIDKSLPDDIESNINESFLKIWEVEGKADPTIHCAVEKSKTTQKQWVLATSESHVLQEDYPRLAGKLAIADATRNLACFGAKPKGIIIRNIFPDSTDPEVAWHGFELIQGQEEAIRTLHLPVLHRSVTPIEDANIQSLVAVGQRMQQKDNMFLGFKSDGDFISILGSHRGELGYGAYMDILHDSKLGHLPACDLNMESRIQDAVVQGIRTNLIKSAQPLGRGGLSVGIADALMMGSDGLGARIHFSRKLRTDQLLFGETQGLVIISLGEEDIMEFERICMSIGVPSTTIGRVTDTGRFTFNEFLDVSVDELK